MNWNHNTTPGLFSEETLFNEDRIYTLGLYYPRRRPEHHSDEWSKAVIKVKGNNTLAIQELSRCAAIRLEEAFAGFLPYVLTYVPVDPSVELLLAKCRKLCTTEVLVNTIHDCMTYSDEVRVSDVLVQAHERKEKQRRCTTAKQRARNVSGCYAVKRPELVKGRNVLVFDDVVTTGATLRECMRVAREGGAREVIGVGLAGTVSAQAIQLCPTQS